MQKIAKEPKHFNQISEKFSFKKPDIYEEYELEERLKDMDKNMQKLISYLQKIFSGMNEQTARVCPNCKEPQFYAVKRKCRSCEYVGVFK